jgi:Fe2+ or Zn2+ uptake regulation protein/uncharacterized protein (DUF4213/DUF364 family)
MGGYVTAPELLKKAGLRRTWTREVVLEALNRVDRPLSHQEIAGEAGLGGIDRVTLYRTLATLQRAGLLHRIQGVDGIWRYRGHDSRPGRCAGNHIHFLCLKCGRMSCLPEQPLPWVKEPDGAEVFGKQLVVYGRCAGCRKQGHREERNGNSRLKEGWVEDGIPPLTIDHGRRTMNNDKAVSILERTRSRFRELVEKGGFLETDVSVLAKPLTPEEAIGTPGRRDFPIIIGKERILEATFLGSKGQAFTDSAREFTGTVGQVLEMELTSNQNRAIYVATLNAVLGHLGLVQATVHCKDEDPEKCGAEIARHILERYGRVTVGIIGLNPAIADHIVQVFGVDRVHLSDLYTGNIGRERFGVDVWDGGERTEELIEKSDVILMTGTTLQNDTFDDIQRLIEKHGKTGLVYGVTAAGVCALTGIERICPYGRDS